MSTEIIKSAVLLLWLLFAIWCYLVIVYLIGSIWLLQKKNGRTYVSWLILAIVLSLMIAASIVHGAMVYFYATKLKDVFSTSDNNEFTLTTIQQVCLFVLVGGSLILTFSQMICFFFYTNNMIVHVGTSSFSLLGLTVFFSSITEMNKSKSGRYWVVQYVYKQEKSLVWKERIRFLTNGKLTKILQKQLPKLVDVKKNNALFDLLKNPTKSAPKAKPVTPSKTAS